MLTAAQQDPVAFEQHFAQIATAEGLWQLIIGMSGECDRVLYESEPFSTTYQRALQEGGYARYLVNALLWTVNVENITVPADLWYGALDTSTVHSPDFGVTLASRLQHASHTIDPQAGGSILWTKAGDN